jgi:hypothetical protein
MSNVRDLSPAEPAPILENVTVSTSLYLMKQGGLNTKNMPECKGKRKPSFDFSAHRTALWPWDDSKCWDLRQANKPFK